LPVQVGIILLLIGVFPTWPHSVNLGCFARGAAPGVLIVGMILLLGGLI
jgi:uncharacterized protein DUF3309